MRTLRPLVLVALLLGLVLPQAASAAALGPQRTWHGRQIHLYDAQKAGFTGRGVTVAILDGWVDVHHKDFGGRAVSSADCTSGKGCTTSVGRDTCGQNHGTHVAGTLASSSYGVAPKARLLAIRVLAADSSGDCAGTPPMVAAGIAWAVNHGAQVINLSLGPDFALSSSTIPDAVHQAAAQGVVVVFSAGNNTKSLPQSYGDDALVVAATGPSGKLATYSQRGQGVSVAAPGGQPSSGGTCSQAACITSLYPGNQYAVAAGTSMAAPSVAGLAALLLQQRPGRGRADVVRRIEGTAHALSGAGSGLIDVAAALGVHRTSTPPPTKKPVVRHHHSPAPTAKPTPVVRAQNTPSPRPRPVVTTAAPSPTASATSVADPPVSAPRTVLASGASTDIPLPLAGVAGALIGLVGVAVILFGGRRPEN